MSSTLTARLNITDHNGVLLWVSEPIAVIPGNTISVTIPESIEVTNE